jgi:hypothetical protein
LLLLQQSAVVQQRELVLAGWARYMACRNPGARNIRPFVAAVRASAPELESTKHFFELLSQLTHILTQLVSS